MRRVYLWGGMLCLLLAACQTTDQALPTLMSLPTQASSTVDETISPTTPAALTSAPTQERTRAAIVLSATPTVTLTPTELPPLPSREPTETPTIDSFAETLAALSATPAATDEPSSGQAISLIPTSILLTSIPTTVPPRCSLKGCDSAPSAEPTITPSLTITPTSTAAVVLPLRPSPTSAPTLIAWYEKNRVHSEEPVTLYDGPGSTYPAVGVLNADVEVRIVERNRIGNWLHVRQSENGETLLDGWALIAGLVLEKELRFSQVPVNETLPDANIIQVRFQSTAPLYAAPVIPYISETMRAVYLRGQRLGIRSQAITKIGDSVSANGLYLDPIGHGDTVLGPYDYLADTLTYFGVPRKRESVAAKKGMSSFSILDPLMAPEGCQSDESPLSCELRLQKPAVAFVMFGPNDIRAMDVDEYTTQMSTIVEMLLDNGTIPVLTTFSADPARRSWQKSVAFNLALIDVARKYDVPLMNLWLASRDLPKYGLEGDGVHMRNFGYDYLKFDAGLEAHFGVGLQNLLALRTLEELHNTVMQP